MKVPFERKQAAERTKTQWAYKPPINSNINSCKLTKEVQDDLRQQILDGRYFGNNQ